MVWIWPGDDPPKATIPSLLPPSGFTIHAEVKENPPMMQRFYYGTNVLYCNGVFF